MQRGGYVTISALISVGLQSVM